jgi:hypothetical protein
MSVSYQIVIPVCTQAIYIKQNIIVELIHHQLLINHFITGQGHLLKPMSSVTITYSYSKVGYVCLQRGTLNGQGHLLKPMPSVTITYSYSKVGYVCLQEL